MKFNDFSNNKPKYNLGDIVSIHSGINIPDTPDGEYYNLTMGSVTRNGKLVFSLRTNETNRLLCKGQLIMPTRDVGDCSIIGRTALIDKNNKYFAGNCLYVLTLKKGNPTYLHLYMNSNFARKQISKIIEGGSQKQITLNEIEKIQISFPNLEEQDKVELYGTEILCFLIENLDEIEGDIYEFLADIAGMTPEAFSNLDLGDLVEIIRKIGQENNLSAFFAAVSKLTDSK